MFMPWTPGVRPSNRRGERKLYPYNQVPLVCTGRGISDLAFNRADMLSATVLPRFLDGVTRFPPRLISPGHALIIFQRSAVAN